MTILSVLTQLMLHRESACKLVKRSWLSVLFSFHKIIDSCKICHLARSCTISSQMPDALNISFKYFCLYQGIWRDIPCVTNLQWLKYAYLCINTTLFWSFPTKFRRSPLLKQICLHLLAPAMVLKSTHSATHSYSHFSIPWVVVALGVVTLMVPIYTMSQVIYTFISILETEEVGRLHYKPPTPTTHRNPPFPKTLHPNHQSRQPVSLHQPYPSVIS